MNTLKEIKRQVSYLELKLIAEDNTPMEEDSLLEDYTNKFDDYCEKELEFYYKLL